MNPSELGYGGAGAIGVSLGSGHPIGFCAGFLMCVASLVWSLFAERRESGEGE